VSSVPAEAVPASAFVNQQEVVLTGIGKLVTLHAETEEPDLQWIWNNLQLPSNIKKELTNDIDIMAVSDGSFKEEHGTAAWIVVVSDKCCIEGKVITPGLPSVQSAYRSELAGIFGILATITLLEKRFHVRANITIGCDGLSAIHRASYLHDCVDPNALHYDLIMACQSLQLQSLWSFNWHHVRGHQDEVRPTDALDHWEQLNIRMDKAAKAFHKETCGTTITPNLYGEPWRVLLNGRKISSRLKEELRSACTAVEAMKYWDGKKRFGEGSTADVDWDAFGAALKLMPTKRQHWISKTTSGFCAVGTMMFRRQEHPSPACPRCNDIETVEHVWRCKHETSDIWEKSLSNLQEWMLQHDTHPEMARMIIEGLRAWRSGQPVQPNSTVEWAKEAAMQQAKLGWRNFFEGMLSINWRDAQYQYLQQIGSRRTSTRWVTATCGNIEMDSNMLDKLAPIHKISTRLSN
jgi:hypothetical protein